MEISVDLADAKRVWRDIAKAEKRLDRLREKWLGVIDNDDWDMLLYVSHELNDARQELGSWMEDYWYETARAWEKLERWTAWASGGDVTTATGGEARTQVEMAEPDGEHDDEEPGTEPMFHDNGELIRTLATDASPGLRAFLNQTHCLDCGGLLSTGDAHGKKWVAAYKYCPKCDKFAEFQSEGLPEAELLEFREFLKNQLRRASQAWSKLKSLRQTERG